MNNSARPRESGDPACYDHTKQAGWIPAFAGMSGKGENAVKKMSLVLIAFLAALSTANAQNYPDRPVKMIVSIAAGSVTDVIMRTAAARLQERLGQPFVV